MNWLPRDRLLKPVCSIKDNLPVWVSELIDQSTRTLQEFFTPMDWEIIESIPLCTMLLGDFWAWHYEKSGVFMVRSAYPMMVQTKECLGGPNGL